MIEPIFFPRRQAESLDVQSIKSSAQEALKVMHEVLKSHAAQNSEVNSKLRDQLVWLQQQMMYFSYSQDATKFQEDFDWVANNFNQNLSLSKGKEINKIIKKHLN